MPMGHEYVGVVEEVGEDVQTIRPGEFVVGSELVDLIWDRTIEPGKVFDFELPLDETAAGYEAMDERRAIKALLRP